MKTVLTAVLIATVLGSARAQTEKYQPTWSSLRQHSAPAWLDGLKFGIYCHWGPQTAINASGNPQMSRLDAIDQWTGEKFSAKTWVDLIHDAGAQFMGIVSWHGTGLVNWDSKVTDWNSVKKGPHVDIVGELSREARRHHMKVLTSFHSLDIWGTVSPSNPTYIDPRGAPPPLLKGPEGRRSTVASDGWLARIDEVIDAYKPDMIWFDTDFGSTVGGELKHRFLEGRLLDGADAGMDGVRENYQQRMISHYFNAAETWGKSVEIIYKSFDIPPGIGMRDIEDGNLTGLQFDPWMADINLPIIRHYPSPWFYNPKNELKSADLIVDLLVDLTSKNGRMLLNVPPLVDGTFAPEIVRELKEIGGWLKINGEAIYDTSPWVFYGEGPTAVTSPGHHGQSKNKAADIAHYGEKDIRFTQKDNYLYAICLGWPGQELRIRTLGSKGKLYPGDIKSIRLLGTDEELTWHQSGDALVVKFPEKRPCDFAYCLKIER